MKWLIASDIHGSAFYCEKLLNAFKNENAEKLLLLGDILYHGPRNDLPEGYAPKKVIPMLNEIKDKIICVRGNCDAEVDQMVLEFPIMSDFTIIPLGERALVATHGHKYGPANPPALQQGDVLLCGHTHVPACEKVGGITYLNPGSVSIPKENSPHSFMVFDGGAFVWKDLDGNEHKKFSLKDN